MPLHVPLLIAYNNVMDTDFGIKNIQIEETIVHKLIQIPVIQSVISKN
jgi:hypothetical protein